MSVDNDVFKNVSYKDLCSRFVTLDKTLKLDNPKNINKDQANNMFKAFSLSYLNLTDDLTELQKLNSVQLVDMAGKRILDFECMAAFNHPATD